MTNNNYCNSNQNLVMIYIIINSVRNGFKTDNFLAAIQLILKLKAFARIQFQTEFLPIKQI